MKTQQRRDAVPRLALRTENAIRIPALLRCIAASQKDRLLRFDGTDGQAQGYVIAGQQCVFTQSASAPNLLK
jgi:hypothetical protein